MRLDNSVEINGFNQDICVRKNKWINKQTDNIYRPFKMGQIISEHDVKYLSYLCTVICIYQT